MDSIRNHFYVGRQFMLPVHPDRNRRDPFHNRLSFWELCVPGTSPVGMPMRCPDMRARTSIKALTGESQLDLSVINSMLVKHRAKMAETLDAMEEAEGRMNAEKQNV